MVKLARKKMLRLAKQFEGRQIDFDGKDGPQCADFSAFLIRNATGQTIQGNAIYTDSKDNIDIINESADHTAKRISPNQKPKEGDLLVEDTGGDIGHVSIINKVLPDGKVEVFEQNYNGDAETNPQGVERRVRNMADKDGWGTVEGYLRIEG